MDEIERRIEEFKKLTNSVREEAKNLREVALCQVREEEEKKEEKKKRHYEEELKHKEAKLKVKRNHEKKLQEDLNKPSKECGVKLPSRGQFKLYRSLRGAVLKSLRFLEKSTPDAGTQTQEESDQFQEEEQEQVAAKLFGLDEGDESDGAADDNGWEDDDEDDDFLL
ncbi:hypothetical protein ACROYT_G015943 [Oculina patagonica]